jgi:integrase
VGVSVNLKMILAFLLSGFFMRKGWWTKSLLLVFVLPWATPALPAYISAFDIAAGSGPKTFHVRRLKGSVDSVHTLDRDEVSALRKLKADSTSPFVFVSERGGPLSPDTIARIVERAGEAAKLGFHVHPHMLRHATGYALANDGTDTRLIQDFLGHASIANTVRYTKLAPGRLAAVRVR